MLLDHGGNLYRIKKNQLIDFSSSINPLGIRPWLRRLIKNNLDVISQYPDPECVFLRQVLSKYLGVNKDNILAGNGSNELIHLVPRVLNCKSALICQPTFSEYEQAVHLTKAKSYFLYASKENFIIDTKKIIDYVSARGKTSPLRGGKKVDLIILCNPNNPTGQLVNKDELLELARYCEKNRTYLLIDEAFMEFVKDENEFSLKKEIQKYKYLLVLKSLTKFFCLPGLRIGYLLADKNVINEISSFQPTWSVNSLSQSIVTDKLFDQSFIKKTKEYIAKEREFLFRKLNQISGIYAFSPSANFIFCKILDNPISAKFLYLALLKYGIVIRDCSNFKGLDDKFFRVAVKKHKENTYLINCLQKIFK